MEILLPIIGGITLFNLFVKKEGFQETYFDSESYRRQDVSIEEAARVNKFSPNEGQENKVVWANNFNGSNNTGVDYFNLTSDQKFGQETQADWINRNSIYNNKTIHGIPLKDYYEQYTNDVLNNGSWYLNKDMPQETRQYEDDSIVQQKMEQFTGLLQKRDRIELGKPNRAETMNLYTPQEKTTGYGYQYGNGTGPGLSLTRQKELEDLKTSIKFKTNEMPFEKIQVGRGLALGSEVPASGGFQQYTRIVPDNISDYAANQLPGRVAGGKWAYSNAPTSSQPVLKNRPNGYYSLCQRGPATGKSTITAELVRPDFSVVLKNQNRSVINYGFGAPLTGLDSFLCAN